MIMIVMTTIIMITKKTRTTIITTTMIYNNDNNDNKYENFVSCDHFPQISSENTRYYYKFASTKTSQKLVE